MVLDINDFMFKPTSERLRIIRDLMIKSRARSREGIFKTLRIMTKCPPNKLKKFNLDIHGHKYHGVIYLVHNSMYGSIFAYYDNKVVVIRGYPKIRYAESSKVMGKYCWAEWKHDGTNLIFFSLPDGNLEGKTREVPYIFGRVGYKKRRYDELISDTNFLDNINNLCKLGFSVCGELFGYNNEGEFIRYTIPIDFEVFNIIDMNTLKFLPVDKARSLCKKFGLKHVKILSNGYLTNKFIEKLEHESKDLLKIDGSEGLVCKTWNEETKDIQMCKVKCKEIKELCWAMSPRKSIPRGMIAKAVRKAWENQRNLESIDAIINFVKEEIVEDTKIFLEQKRKNAEKQGIDLPEEKLEDIIDRSVDRIKREIFFIFSSEAKYDTKVFDFLKVLENKGIEVSIENKGKVLSLSASKFKGISPSLLYNSFMSYIKENKKS